MRRKIDSSTKKRKQKNEDSCPLYKLSNDVLKLIFGSVGENNYRFVACTSYRFSQVYLDTFGGETSTSIDSALASVSCAALYLHSEEESGCDSSAKSLFDTAAKEGKLEILKWGADSGYELNTILDKDTIANAAMNGHFEVVKHLRTVGIEWDSDTCAYAALNGHLQLLKWARAENCPWNARTCSKAAMNGHIKLLKWARAENCPWDARTYSSAASNGDLNLLKWARANKCPWNEWTCSKAARHGHLEILKWARVNGCPWDEETCYRAAKYGHLKLLTWAMANGCPWEESICSVIELFEWARSNGQK